MKKRILFADNEDSIVNNFSLLLEKSGYVVETAGNGHEAFTKVVKSKESGEPFDLLITDVKMSVMDGLELLEKLNSKQLKIPTIAITGYRDSYAIRELINTGCDSYLCKPFATEKLIGTVKKLIGD
tara:strand:+ start:635 stop:1012 length:378 start_codon:yes stop_codon:yes gene_type:complete